ncbi:MAG: transposase [Prosthecobacter sp.]|nr:transposase [Prosthecobacter sp.]
MTAQTHGTGGGNGAGRRRHHDEEFKREAVALLGSGRKIKQLATELGVSHWTLRDWRERYGAGAATAGLPARSAGQGSAGAASTIALSVQLADLRRELEVTRRQRDILKKALAIVGQDPSSATP